MRASEGNDEDDGMEADALGFTERYGEPGVDDTRIGDGEETVEGVGGICEMKDVRNGAFESVVLGGEGDEIEEVDDVSE